MFFLLLMTLTAAVGVSVMLMHWLPDWRVALPLALLIALLLLWYSIHVFFEPLRKTIQTLNDGVSSFQDNDFSITIRNERKDELGVLIDVYNQLASTLRQERFHLFQRELLLDTIIQTSPLALLLTNIKGIVLYSNHAAQTLFSARVLQGRTLTDICGQLPPALSRATLEKHEGLYSVEQDNEHEIYHLSCRSFLLNNQHHTLYLYKQLTREITRQEVITWKKVIRLISHELNNSLGPIASLTASGLRILEQQTHLHMLPDILATIAQRSERLHQFIEGYAQFARLPAPRKARIAWPAFISRLQTLCEFTLLGTLPEHEGYFDAAQIEQVLINLVKNAHESGSDKNEIHLYVEHAARETQLQVLDRGGGMQEAQLQYALMPFYSTKQSGTGLGLPLCREIIEAHGGRLRLVNREGGGFMACCILPLQ